MTEIAADAATSDAGLEAPVILPRAQRLQILAYCGALLLLFNLAAPYSGLIGIPIVAYLSGGGHWTTAFVIGTVFAILGAVMWLGIDADEIIHD